MVQKLMDPQSVFRALVIVVLSVSTWVLLQVIEIRGNRFTSEQGLLVWQEVGRIQTAIAKLPPKAPPDEFEARMVRVELRVNQNAEMLSRILGMLEGLDTPRKGKKNE